MQIIEAAIQLVSTPISLLTIPVDDLDEKEALEDVVEELKSIKIEDVKEIPSTKDEETLDVDEESLEKLTKIEENPDLPVIYGFNQEQFFQETGKPVGYMEIFYGGKNNVQTSYQIDSKEEIWADTVEADTESLVMDEQEAKATFTNIQYSAAMGDSEVVSVAERKRFANWVVFNPALQAFYHQTYSLTGDVDYSRIF